jgi:hypothetical protein
MTFKPGDIVECILHCPCCVILGEKYVVISKKYNGIVVRGKLYTGENKLSPSIEYKHFRLATLTLEETYNRAMLNG